MPVNNHCLRFLLIVLVLGVGTGCATRAQPRPFTSDGCSDFPNGTPTHRTLWLACCTEHDKTYWQGGTYAERRHADQVLRQCVTRVGQPEVAAIMLAGARVGGSPYWPTRFRWGYGWPWPRGYRALTSEERAQVQQALRGWGHPQPE